MKQPPICTVANCGSPTLAKGLCRKHYDRLRKNGSVDLPPPAKDRLCSECGERWAAYSSGKCRPCYRKERLAAAPHQGVCLQCGEPFTSQRRYAPGSGRGMYCSRECKTLARIADGRAAVSTLRHYYKKQYGLTVEQVRELRSQGCAICGEAGTEGRWGNLHMDHDHQTGRFRGPLCHNCNTGLGRFNDDPAILQKAIDYLARSGVTNTQ